jgi:isoleucyl-tRNA synthetase
MLGEIAAESSFTRIEEDVHRFWRRHAVPEALRAARRDGLPCVMYQQPLVPAGQPVADQIRLLATADLYARYHAMRGHAVHRQAGWACHGLPVEVAVERSLGPDLAGLDLARFNAACSQAAAEGLNQGETLAERLGVWLDPAAVYATMSRQAIGAVWGALRRLWDAGRLQHQRCVVSVCPRCATPLSMMEASRRAVEADTCSIWLRLPWDGEADAYFLTWTSVPWTLLGMVALAIHPDASYGLVELPGREGRPATRVLLAEAALERTLTVGFRLVKRIPGRSLHSAGYHPPFTFRPLGDGLGRLVLSEAVPLDRGTGLLPVTPAFDAPSLALAQLRDLPVPELLDDWGNFVDSVTSWRGLSPLDAEPLLVDHLHDRGLLFRKEGDVRPRPLCPYCETPLLPQARHVWLLETDSGPWIVGRDRAWGVPLPVWTCERCQESVCLAGLDDLAHRTGLDVEHIVPHRPAVDGATWPCQACGGTMRRVAPVVDAGFETAVLPWTVAPQSGPADLAVGLGDKHLGWLGDLAEAAALLRGTLAWEQALALPEAGIGAALDLERAQPADAVRWAVYSQSTPEQAENTFLRPLWRLVVPSLADLPAAEREEAGREQLLDRWLQAGVYRAIGALTEALDRCDHHRAAAELAMLVDDLAAWYSPLRPQGLRPVLGLLCALLAPFVPHLAEAIHRQAGKRAVESIHLAVWPFPDPGWEDRPLLARMAQVRRLAALGRAARLQAGLEAGRPLGQAILYLHGQNAGGATDLAPFQDLLAEVLGVTRVQFSPQAIARVEWHLALDARQAVERKIPPGAIQAALHNLDAQSKLDITLRLWDGLSVSVDAGGQAVTLLPDEVRITAGAQPGWVAAAANGLLLILETG